MTGTIIATCIMTLYLGWYVISFGIPGSISQTVYKLPHEAFFTLVMYAIAFLTIMPMIDACSENTQVLAFLSIAGVGFVGAAPLGKNCDERVHMGGALFFGVCSQTMLALNRPTLLLIWLPAAIVLLVVRGKNYLFWVEIACIADLLVFCQWQ